MSLNVTADGCKVSGQPAFRAFRVGYIGLDLALTLAGNALTILVAGKAEKLPQGTRLLITGLACADLGVSSVVALSLVSEALGRFPFPDWVCVASFLAFYAFTASSIYMIVLMTLDRLVAVVRPLRYSLVVTATRCRVAVGSVCIGSVLGAVLTTATNEVRYDECSALCAASSRGLGQSLASLAVFYVLPLALILPANLKLLHVARQHAIRRVHDQTVAFRASTPRDRGGAVVTVSKPRASPRAPGAVHGKAIGIVTLVTTAFVASWSLFYVMLVHSTTLSAGSGRAYQSPEWLVFGATWFALTNSWWNVLIYALMNRSFREQLLLVLRRPCRGRQHGQV